MATPARARTGARSRTTARVRYPETDRMGVAYHAHYLVWFELGRTELMRELACAYGDLEDCEGIYFPVVRVGARYRESARYDEEIEIFTWLVDARGARVKFEYEIRRAGSARLVADGFTEHAAVGSDGRPRRLTEQLLRRLRGREPA